jgi:hypothetical protein
LELLSAGLDDATIIAQFAQRFGIAPEVAAADLTSFRAMLKRHSLSTAPTEQMG